MGKMVLITVAAASMTGAIMLSSMQSSTTAAEKQIMQYRAKETARSAAKTGYTRIKRHVWERWAQGEWTFEDTLYGSYEGADYEAIAASEDSSGRAVADVTITGDLRDPRVGQTHTIDAVFSSPSTGTVPPPFRRAVFSDGDLTVNGTVDISSDSAGVNADVHTNTDLVAEGATNTVDGFGSYAGGTDFDPPSLSSSMFTPNLNPNGDPTLEEASTIDVPTFDPDEFDADTTTSDISWTGTNEVDFTSLGSGLGTESNPAVWRVNGDVEIDGSVTVKGYGVFVTTGGVEILGNASTTQAADPPGWLGIYAEGDLTFSGTPDIHGQLFTNGDASVSSGTPRITGNLVSAGRTTFNGTPDLDYVQADPNLPMPGAPTTATPGLTVDAFSEW